MATASAVASSTAKKQSRSMKYALFPSNESASSGSAMSQFGAQSLFRREHN